MTETGEGQRAAEVLGLYPWRTGSCFRCARTGLPTTRVAVVEFGPDDTYDVRSCADCMLDLEEMHRQAVERDGGIYQPGRLGRAES